MRAIWFLVLCSACSLNIDYEGTYFQCNPDGTCPPGFQCLDLVCVPADPVPPACSSGISAGGGHSCAVRKDGKVWCWGRNDIGQLGDGTAEDSDLPVAVDDTNLVKATQVGAGAGFSCALDDTGQVWCWGLNDSGQLGDGSPSGNRTPVMVMGVSNAVELSVGDNHACALRTDRTIACWGENGNGQLGDGSTLDKNLAFTPDVPPTRSVTAGYNATCAVLMDGTAQCWGENNDGELGVGDSMPHPRPTPVVDLTNLKQVAIGDNFTCFLSVEGFVHCAGDNSVGQLGTATTLDSPRPVPTQLPQTLSSIDAGGGHMCGVDVPGGNVWCWGYGLHGRLLDAGIGNRYLPERGLVEKVVAVSGGDEHTCVLDNQGAVYCAGFNPRGALGDGRAITSGSPLQISGVSNAVSIVAGARHTCASQQDGKVLCWGLNDSGQAGNGNFIDEQTVPHVVYGITKPTQMVAGAHHTCVLLADKHVYCWGDNGSGRLGDLTQTTSANPRHVVGVDDASAISIGDYSSFALVGNDARCWGDRFGLFPTTIANVLSIAAGRVHACTVEPDRTVTCFGENNAWQLGDGSNTPSPTPVTAVGVASAGEVFTRGDSTCATIMDGTIKCWGNNDQGRLGVGNADNPTQRAALVMGMSNVKKLAMGWEASCALKTDNTVWCWGINSSGQVGDASYQVRHVPVQLLGLTGAKDVASGVSHSCAIDGSGNVHCWGFGGNGQLGTGIRQIIRPVGVRMSCPE